MKYLLVTSQTTYVPYNYYVLLEEVLGKHNASIDAIILLKNADFNIAKSIIATFFCGAHRFALTLFKNLFESLFCDKRVSLAKKFNIPIIKASSMNDKSIVDYVVNKKIDVVFNLRTRCIYKKEILNAPRLGCINIHHGLLPDNRGTMCDLHAIFNNNDAGFSIHKMNEKIDDGNILDVCTVANANNNFCDKDYLKYLLISSKIEGEKLSNLITQIESNGVLPQGKKNISNNKKYYKNPDYKLIKKMKRRNVKL